MSDPALDRFFGDVIPGKKPRRPPLDTPTKVETEEAAWDAKPLIMYRGNVETEFFLIGDLARALGKKPVTIRYWEDNHIFPLATFRTEAPRGEQVPGKKTQGKRLYTRAQIEVAVAAARESGVLTDARKADWKKFTTMVVDGWRRLS